MVAEDEDSGSAGAPLEGAPRQRGRPPAPGTRYTRAVDRLNEKYKWDQWICDQAAAAVQVALQKGDPDAHPGDDTIDRWIEHYRACLKQVGAAPGEHSWGSTLADDVELAARLLPHYVENLDDSGLLPRLPGLFFAWEATVLTLFAAEAPQPEWLDPEDGWLKLLIEIAQQEYKQTPDTAPGWVRTAWPAIPAGLRCYHYTEGLWEWLAHVLDNHHQDGATVAALQAPASGAAYQGAPCGLWHKALNDYLIHEHFGSSTRALDEATRAAVEGFLHYIVAAAHCLADDDVEAVVRAAWDTICRKLSGFCYRARLTTWAWDQVRGAATAQRREAQRVVSAEENVDWLAALLADPSADPATVLLRREELPTLVERISARMYVDDPARRQRMLIGLKHFLFGYTAREIARLLGLTEQQVKDIADQAKPYLVKGTHDARGQHGLVLVLVRVTNDDVALLGRNQTVPGATIAYRLRLVSMEQHHEISAAIHAPPQPPVAGTEVVPDSLRTHPAHPPAACRTDGQAIIWQGDVPPDHELTIWFRLRLPPELPPTISEITTTAEVRWQPAPEASLLITKAQATTQLRAHRPAPVPLISERTPPC